ncbi:MAG: SH3 domain-containing protein, partial [Caldilineae bacterium]
IRDSRAEIVDALYPIIGQIVMKAVTEAIRDLARTIDERVHTALDFQNLWRRVKSWLTGVPEGELALREALPFAVQEIFLIHRESGLLLWHGSRDETGERDPDLVSGMLTAIRDFAQEVMGGQEEDALDELHFGPQLIVMEFARYTYVAAVCRGVPPVHFRAELRRRLYAFDGDAHEDLRQFDGNVQALAQPASSHFQPLLGEE